MHNEILCRLHEGHQGKMKCRLRAHSTVWWSGIGRDIDATIEACQHCREHQKTKQEEPLRPSVIPNRPWERLGADLFAHKRCHYLVVVDYYSRWIEVKLLATTTTIAVVGKFKQISSAHGIADVIQSDNAPQFASGDFAAFAKAYGFEHLTSSPHLLQANGEAERAVQTAKRILDQPQSDLALLNYRSTPH